MTPRTRMRPRLATRTSRATIAAKPSRDPIDAAEHVAHRSSCRLAALDQDRAQRRAQRQRVEGRDQHRDRHRDRELAEELTADSRNEGDRHEDGKQHERDGDDRRGDLGHRHLGGLRHRKLGLLLDHAFHILDHDDGIVDDDADGEHQRQQGHGIGGVADEKHHGEGADDRDRHGDQRNERRAEFAEE